MSSPGTELASLDFANLIAGPLNAVITAQSNAAMSTANFIKTVGFDADNKPIYVDFNYPKEIAPYQPKQNPKVIEAKVSTTGGSGYTANQVINVSFSGASGEIKATGTLTADASGNIPVNTMVEITNQGDYPTTTSVTATADGPSGPTKPTIVVTLSSLVPASEAIFQEMKFSVPILTMLPIPFIKVDQITIDFNAKINSVQTQSEASEFSAAGNVEAGYGGKRAYVKFTGSVAYKKTNAIGSSIERTYSMGIHVQASQDEMPAGMEKLLNILEGAMISTPGKITQGK